MKKIVIATKNEGKLREMRAALSALPVEVLSLSELDPLPDAVEDGATFEDNARIKAHFFCRRTGLACIADDSGLEVEALGGAPGVHSARFNGVHGDDAANNEKLVKELEAKGCSSSAADYRCVLVFEDTDGRVIKADGRVDGWVRLTPSGSGGFGYDPYFYLSTAQDAKTMAELTMDEKNALSHRGKALRLLVPMLEDYLS